MVCTGKVVNMQHRLNPRAVARDITEGYNKFPPLSQKELSLLLFALRFCPVPNILERLDADSKRAVLKEITDIT